MNDGTVFPGAGKKAGKNKKTGRGRARRKSQQVRKRQAVQGLVERAADPRMYRIRAVSGNWQAIHDSEGYFTFAIFTTPRPSDAESRCRRHYFG
jgi:hypothetical protein